MTDLDERIRRSLARTAERAPQGVLDLERLDGRSATSGAARRRRWPVLVSAACVVLVIAAVFAVLGDHLHRTTSPKRYANPTFAIPPNPSTHPDFDLCDSIATTAGRDGVLVRAVTVPAARLADWLHTSFSTYPRLDPTAETTICVFHTELQPAPGPEGHADADGVRVLAQATGRWALEAMGPVTSLFAELDPLAAEQQERLNSRPVDGFLPGLPPGKPCRFDAHRSHLPTRAAQRKAVRIPDSVLAHPGNLEGWTCGDIPAITAPGIRITFESGYKSRSRAQLERDAGVTDRQQAEGGWPAHTSTFVATVLGSPVLVYQPTDWTLGEVMYVHDGMLMRVLGDGTVPTRQLLAVVQTSTPLGDRTVPEEAG